MDFESGIVKYEVCVTSGLQNCTVTTFVDAELNRSFIVGGLNLTHGKTYYAIVRGTNRIGLSSEMTSNGVLIDLTLPTPKNDGTLSSLSYTTIKNLNDSMPKIKHLKPLKDDQISSPVTLICSEEYLTSRWEYYEDRESGILKYDWCVGTAKASCDIVSMRSVGTKTQGAAIVKRLRLGMRLFSTVYAENGAKLRRRIVSDPCTVITIAPKLAEVIDISSLNTDNFTDIDWKGNLQSLTLRWNVIGSYLDESSRLRVQVAVTKLSSNLSVPRIRQDMSWNGESLEHPFMDVLPWQRNVTIRRTFLPWERYRGIVKMWNEGGIYSEACSDGLKMEPSPPPTRGLKIRDKAAENEHLRWLPNLRIPPVNESAVDTDVTFISSPAELELTVNSDESNKPFNRTEFLLEHNMFSPTAKFEIVVKRVTSGNNDINLTSQSTTMKVIPGFADLEGACCARKSNNAPSALSDTHFKPTLPIKDFGVSLAVLQNDVVAIGCKGKVVVQHLKNQTASYSIALDDHSDPNARVKISSYENRTGFLLNGKLYLYNLTAGEPGESTLIKAIVVGKFKIVSASDCADDEAWADNLGQAFALNQHVIAVTGTNSTNNNSVVAVFRENFGKWRFTEAIGENLKDPNFGHSISLNDRTLAIAAGHGKNCCVFIYSLPALVVRKTICLANSVAPLTIHLTDTDALVVLSKASRLLKVFQINITSNSYHNVCEYRAVKDIDELSGNLAVNSREEGFVVALGIEALNGAEGVQLLGFQGIYSKDLDKRKVISECVNLGSVLAKESGITVDGMDTRTSVSFKGNTILFGIPGVLTWPNTYQWSSTGKVFMATYCPLNHFRTRVYGVQSLLPISCQHCEQGRKSFGGFSETCSVCEGRICYSPQINESSSFTSGICDEASCLSTLHVSNKTNGINVQLSNGSLFVAGSKHVYTVEVLETTRAGESTSSLSGSFVIDSTAPLPGVVYDGRGSDQNVNCSDNSTFGENSQCSTRNFEDTDVKFTNNTREVHARWIDFLDNESDIVEYFWCVGRNPMTDDIQVCESTGMRPNGSHHGLSLKHGDSYYVTVIACNGARMCSAAHSDGVIIDTTPPVMTYVRDGVMGPDMDYQV